MSGNNRIYLKGLTQALTECASEGTTYAKCVAVKESVKLNDCSSEFNALRNCVIRTSSEVEFFVPVHQKLSGIFEYYGKLGEFDIRLKSRMSRRQNASANL